jgi:hypothetical protein
VQCFGPRLLFRRERTLLSFLAQVSQFVAQVFVPAKLCFMMARTCCF